MHKNDPIDINSKKLNVLSIGGSGNGYLREENSGQRNLEIPRAVSPRPPTHHALTSAVKSDAREKEIDKITKDLFTAKGKVDLNRVLLAKDQSEQSNRVLIQSPQISAYPMGAHYAGHYSKLRNPHAKDKLPVQAVSALLQGKEKQERLVIKQIEKLKIEVEEPTVNTIELQTAVTMSSKMTDSPSPAIIDFMPSPNSNFLPIDFGLVDELLVLLTDSDSSISGCLRNLNDLIMYANINPIEFSKYVADRGAIAILLSVLNLFSTATEIQSAGLKLITIMIENNESSYEMISKKNGLKAIINASKVTTKNFSEVHNSQDSLESKNRQNESPSRKPQSSFRALKTYNKSPKPISDLPEAEEEVDESIYKTNPLPHYAFTDESLLNGLLSEYYSPNFIRSFEELPKKGRIQVVRDLLTQFEKIDRLLSATNCASLDMDLDKALQKIMIDTYDIMQAELILFYEVNHDTNELIAKHFHLSASDEERASIPIQSFPLDSGIAGYVASTKELINIKEPLNFPQFHPAIDAGGMELPVKSILASHIALPNGPVIAVIEIMNKMTEDGTSSSFDEKDEYLLKLLSRTIAIIMTNAQAIERMKQTKKKVEVLLDTTKSLSSTLEFDKLIKMIMEAAKELLNADRCTLFLKDNARKQLVAQIVMKDSIQEIRIKMDAGIAGSVCMSGESVNIRDAYKDSRFNREVDKQTGYITKTILCMPIKNAGGETIGVTQMINKTDGIFTTDDEMILSSFSAQAAVAIEKTQLFKKTEDMRLYQQSILSSITSCVITLNESMRMVSMNRPWFANTIGSTEEIMMEHPINKWIGSQNESVLQDIYSVYKEGASIFVSEYELKSEKTNLFVNYQIMPLKITGGNQAVGVVIVLDDISSEKKAVMTLGRYMSPELAKQVMLEDGGQLGGKRKIVSILFSDIRSFTTLSESMEPHEVVELLNQHFTGAVNAIIEEHGILDKFIGDAVMAVFGVPFATAEDATNSCNAALRMKEAVKILNDNRLAAGLRGIKIGIGVNTGMVLSGNIGSPKRMEYSCIGDAVNLSSRVEGLTKGYGVAILVTEFTLAYTGDIFIAREVDAVVVQGKSLPVKIYELVGRRTDPIPEDTMKACSLYKEALDLYRARQFEQAIELFQQNIEVYQDGPSKTMIERAFKYLDNPPGKEWNGIYVAEGNKCNPSISSRWSFISQKPLEVVIEENNESKRSGGIIDNKSKRKFLMPFPATNTIEETANINTNTNTLQYTPFTEHLGNSPITKVSPPKGSFPDTTNTEEDFNSLCAQIKGPIQMIAKKEIDWNNRDPLHFFQSLAFLLKTEDITCLAVTSFLDNHGETKLYIATNEPLASEQQSEITDIINMFLDMEQVDKISAKVLPRHLSLIIKQFRKGAAVADAFINDFPGELSTTVDELMFKRNLTLEDMKALMKLIVENRRALRSRKDDKNNTEASRRMAYHLCKIIRLYEEINFVWKKVKLHQQDQSLKFLSRPFSFVSLHCHAELTLLKIAKDCCYSQTLYIGVSKRPCYCCSLLFKAVTESMCVSFSISIVPTHGKLYSKWNKVENYFEEEFKQVWAKVIEDRAIIQKPIQMVTDENSSVSGSTSEEDNLLKMA